MKWVFAPFIFVCAVQVSNHCPILCVTIQADYIVLLEVSWPIAAWRIIRRHLLKSLRGTNPYPTKLLFNFLKDTRRYYLNKTNPDTVNAVRANLEEQGESAELPDPEVLLMHFEKYSSAIPLTFDFVCVYLEKYKEKVFLIRNNADRERLLELFISK